MRSLRSDYLNYVSRRERNGRVDHVADVFTGAAVIDRRNADGITGEVIAKLNSNAGQCRFFEFKLNLPIA
jgi:hypothetical protein